MEAITATDGEKRIVNMTTLIIDVNIIPATKKIIATATSCISK